MKRTILTIVVILLLCGFTACGNNTDNDTEMDIVADTGSLSNTGDDEEADNPDTAPDTPSDSVNYSLNTDTVDLLGKTPGEIEQLVGTYSGTEWLSGYIHNYGKYWFVFDDAENPSGQARAFVCPLTDVIDGIDADTDAAELDELFGVKGNFVSNEDGSSELHADAYLIYQLDGLRFEFNCLPDKNVKKDSMVWVWKD